jgi:transcriptional regulator with XRE-family HTH domain
MGRPEKPITSEGQVATFAKKLRALRLAAAVGDNHVRNYKSMAARVGVAASTLSQAASGEKLPTWRVTTAYLEACDVTDEEEIVLVRKEWELAAAEAKRQMASAGAVLPQVPSQRTAPSQRAAPSERTDAVPVPAANQYPVRRHRVKTACPAGLAAAVTMSDLVAVLNDLLEDQGLNAAQRLPLAAGEDGHPNLLDALPVQNILTGKQRPTLGVIWQIVNACGGTSSDLAEWASAMQRIEAAERPRAIAGRRNPRSEPGTGTVKSDTTTVKPDTTTDSPDPNLELIGMTVETPPTSARPTPEQAWQYRWDITLTWRSEQDSPTGQIREHYLTASDPDELAEIVLRTSFDPRVVAYRYERHAALDMSGAPKACTACEEPYGAIPPQQWWTPCNCGGHMTYQCVMCGEEQVYPELNITCL